MKIIIIVLLFISNLSIACDGCNVFVNFSPNDYKNRISVFTRNRMMIGEYNMFGLMTLTKHASHGNDPSFWNNQVIEQYNTIEIRGDYYFREKWKTTIILPYVSNQQVVGDIERFRVNGFADPILMESFQIFNSLKSNTSTRLLHRLEAGVGLKFPLGKIDKLYENGLPNLDLQPGTGSLDFIMNFTYVTKYKQFGMYSNLNYKINSFSSESYKYGNSTNVNINLFYQTKGDKVSFIPSVGVYAEQMSFDQSKYTQNNERVVIDYLDTGGQILFANAGLKAYFSKYTVTAEYQKVVGRNLKGYTQLLTRHKINVGMTYNF